MGSQYDGSRGKEVWDEWYSRIGINLMASQNVIADATNLASHHRANLRDEAERYKAEIHAVVFQNVGQAVYRNVKRVGKAQGSQRVPDSAMINFVGLYEKMLVDIESESYDSVTYIGRTA